MSLIKPASEMINFNIAGKRYMSETHLHQHGKNNYSSWFLFAKTDRCTSKIREIEDTRHIDRNKLDKDYLEHNLA